ncbi:MAG: hypothetical protein LBE84_10020 [Planctomycetota bacterium]|nr:hypothetical protein [Planctomycetota bacterium]
MDFINTESRDDVMGAANLFEYFCARTSDDMRVRGAGNETPTNSFAGMILTLLTAAALFIFGRPQIAKAVFIVFAVLLVWTVWGVVIRSAERVEQKADDIRAGVFAPSSLPLVLARLKWWNHLIAPIHWGRHSRLFDRQAKLDRRIIEIERRIDQAVSVPGQGGQPPRPYQPPADEEVAELADKLVGIQNRTAYEAELSAIQDQAARLRSEHLLLLALRRKLETMSETLDRIEKLNVVFQNVSPEDLSQLVSEAIQLLEERRLLVTAVDTINPDDFIDLVTVKTA